MRKWGRIAAVLIAVWLAVGAADCFRVCYVFQKPLFCVARNGADDGGSGHYVGLGYSFDIRGNFLPDAGPADEALPVTGVTRWTLRLFGIPAASGERD